MRLGFIGAGNMAKAIIGGILQAGILPKEEIIASDVSEETRLQAESALGINTTEQNCQSAQADIVFLAVKPVYLASVLREIKETVTEKQVIVSIVAGKTLEWLESELGSGKRIIRTMPNTPALVGAGITAVCPNDKVTEEDLETVLQYLKSFGKAEVLSEAMMDAVVAVSGSSPAYVFID